MNVILFSYLSLVMLSLFLCECHLVFPLLSFVILIICYVKFASYVNVILFPLYCLLSYLSLVMLSLLLRECHLVFPLLSFVILITCYVKFSPMWMSSCLSSLVFCHTYHLCGYVKFAPMWMSSCFPSIVFCHTYHLLC